MNYKGKDIAITGRGGFIAEALASALAQAGARITWIDGDIRDPETFADLDYTFSYFFHFGAPSSQVLFKRQPDYCVDVTINGFRNIAKVCRQHGIKLIYPSTGLLSQDRVNEYARCKKICEDIHLGENLDALGIRIFATYGPGEGHKRDYASVPYLFARDMVNGRAPLIFGDGTQVRDFIYIDDVVQAIMHVAEECNDPIIDIGSGEQISFNDIVRELKVITAGPDAVYVERPGNYVSETLADPKRMLEFYQPKKTFAEGLAVIVFELEHQS